MLKRTLSGAVYVAVIAGIFLLREFVSPLFFMGLILAFIGIGTYEMLRAFRAKLTISQMVAVSVYAAVYLPIAYFWQITGIAALTAAIVVAVLCLLVFDGKTTLDGLGSALLCAFYPTGLSFGMALANDFAVGSLPVLVMMFVIPACADTFAYLVGRAVKGPKLCPTVSPNKTISGAVGGLLGGGAGAVAIYFIFRSQAAVTAAMAGWLSYFLVGLATSVVTIIGDLIESSIKRRLEIKDMGNLMPGHGGILDRIDGTLIGSIFLYVVFSVFFI